MTRQKKTLLAAVALVLWLFAGATGCNPFRNAIIQDPHTILVVVADVQPGFDAPLPLAESKAWWEHVNDLVSIPIKTVRAIVLGEAVEDFFLTARNVRANVQRVSAGWPKETPFKLTLERGVDGSLTTTIEPAGAHPPAR